MYFKPFKPLANYSLVLDRIEALISAREYKNAMELSENLRTLALKGLHYFQTYDWMMLMTVVTLGYLGWIFYLVVHVMQSYSSFPYQIMYNGDAAQSNKIGKVWINTCLCLS